MLLKQKQLAQKQQTSLQQFINFFSLPEETQSVAAIVQHFIKHTNYFTYLSDAFEKVEAHTLKMQPLASITKTQ